MAHGNALPAAAKTYVKECHYNERHTLIYCVTKQICVQLYYVLIGLLPKEEHCKIKVLFGDTDPVERKQILADFASGEVRCIINCMVLTEGTDLPICDAVFNLRPTCNVSLYQQMVGRGTLACIRARNTVEYSTSCRRIPRICETSAPLLPSSV